MEEILGAHPMNDDDFWGSVNPTDVSSDTTNSKEMIAGSYNIELNTHKHKKTAPTELFNKVSNVPEVCDAVQIYQLDPLDKSKNLNMLSKTGNVTHTNGIKLSSQENQDYGNWHDEQLITRKHDGGQGYHNRNKPRPNDTKSYSNNKSLLFIHLPYHPHHPSCKSIKNYCNIRLKQLNDEKDCFERIVLVFSQAPTIGDLCKKNHLEFAINTSTSK